MSSEPGFDHLVVLMLENRSFDNLCGYLYEDDEPRLFLGDGKPRFDGVAGRDDLHNEDGADPPRRYPVTRAPFERPEDMFAPYPNAGEFYHPNVNRQIYGMDSPPERAGERPTQGLMGGFVQDYVRVIRESAGWDGRVEPEPDTVRQIMYCYPPPAVPVLSALARSFAVSDAWFSSVPSSTWPNRSFVHSGTSRGRVLNKPAGEWVRHHDQPTIFERLADRLGEESGWRVYGEEVHYASLTALLHPPLRHRRFKDSFRHLDRFFKDCREGSLPAYSFLEPRMMSDVNDMHPPYWLNPFVASSVTAGEAFVNDVYNAVRTGKRWDRTLLVITFDEHGGLYDHVVPPDSAVPPGGEGRDADFGFRFDRFGLRVPAIFISPYIAEGTVVRATGGTPFDHTSIIRTLCRRWDLEGLTDRDRAAPDFLPVLTLPAEAPRLDPPAVTPRPYRRMPEPRARKAPLGHLAFQIAELSAALLGSALPALDKAEDLLDHLLHHRHQT
ncbi:MAG: alkaline phosphatase family protein [Acidobacteriota bacterium]|jgi:phospholipase C